MKKLFVLKSLVDFIWIMTCIPLIIILLFATIYMFFDPSILEIPFMINKVESINSGLSIKLVAIVLFAVILVVIYCFYLFRKTLRYFQQNKPFADFVINTYNRIGNLLMFSGIISVILFFVIKLVFESKFEIHLGLSPYLAIVCLGLFFMVLSEVFKIAKTAKEENELTI